jgi:hypothetical protein
MDPRAGLDSVALLGIEPRFLGSPTDREKPGLRSRIATSYGLEDRGFGVRVPVGSRIFSSPRRPDRLWVHPTSYKMGTWGSFPEVKRPENEADHSPPANAEVKKMWMYTSTPPYAFMA